MVRVIARQLSGKNCLAAIFACGIKMPLRALWVMGCFPMDFQEVKRPLKTKSVKRPIKVGKRPINEGKRPIKAKVLVGVSVDCLMGWLFSGTPAMAENDPFKKAH